MVGMELGKGIERTRDLGFGVVVVVGANHYHVLSFLMSVNHLLNIFHNHFCVSVVYIVAIFQYRIFSYVIIL